MILSGSKVIAADRQTVWTALNDAEMLQRCIPGCQEMTGNADDGFEAVVTQKIGPVKATFRGSVAISDVVPAQSYRLSGEGKGGAAGFAKGAATVTLEDDPGGTLLTYDVEARVGGKLASLGGRIITGVARKLADRFFENFQQALAPEEEEAEEERAEG